MSSNPHPSSELVSEKPVATSRWKPLRIWPPVILLMGMVFFRFLPSLVEDGPAAIWMAAAFGPAVCGLLVLIWWVSFSRAVWQERVVGFFGLITALVIAVMCLDKTMLGPAVMVLTFPLGIVGFAIGTIALSRWLSFNRTLVALLLAAAGFGVSDLFRSDGMWGNFALGLHWRWVPSSEDALRKVARNSAPAATANTEENDESPAVTEELGPVQCPGFRGLSRDGHFEGVPIATDWSQKAPELLWKIPVGPGWSSFAVAGNRLFTQEQRGDEETVVCYDAGTGREIWTQKIESRFDDPLGGPGPRATPTLADGGLYVMFAKGALMRLNPRDGKIVWQQDVMKTAECKLPIWGFSSSPLVVGSLVMVHAGGEGDKGMLAFDIENGKLKSSVAAGDHSYSSPQLATLMGEQCVLMLTNAGLHIFDPVTLATRLDYKWFIQGYRAIQPQVVNGDSVLLPTTLGAGTRLIHVTKNVDQFDAEEMWTSRNFKPDFNDFVVYQGHAYGFDQAMFTSIDLAKGHRNWKGGRYGKGQALLIESCGLLLVIGEEGDLYLLKADPKAHTELASFKAIEGRTWNHPVLIGDRLYLRNSQEAACYRLPTVQ